LAGRKHARIAQESETTRKEALFPRNKKVKILFDSFDNRPPARDCRHPPYAPSKEPNRGSQEPRFGTQYRVMNTPARPQSLPVSLICAILRPSADTVVQDEATHSSRTTPSFP
jgi:hypothetical protein